METTSGEETTNWTIRIIIILALVSVVIAGLYIFYTQYTDTPSDDWKRTLSIIIINKTRIPVTVLLPTNQSTVVNSEASANLTAITGTELTFNYADGRTKKYKLSGGDAQILYITESGVYNSKSVFNKVTFINSTNNQVILGEIFGGNLYDTYTFQPKQYRRYIVLPFNSKWFVKSDSGIETFQVPNGGVVSKLTYSDSGLVVE